MKKELHLASLSELYYFRTADHVEIDLIVDRKSSKDYIEIKKSATFHPRMAQGLKKYAEPGCRSIVLYQGEKYTYQEVTAMPYSEYLAE